MASSLGYRPGHHKAMCRAVCHGGLGNIGDNNSDAKMLKNSIPNCYSSNVFAGRNYHTLNTFTKESNGYAYVQHSLSNLKQQAATQPKCSQLATVNAEVFYVFSKTEPKRGTEEMNCDTNPIRSRQQTADATCHRATGDNTIHSISCPVVSIVTKRYATIKINVIRGKLI
ncbi:hypothetical protein ElyMa_005576900 [Elysia marginata]|uniref:Uncharacterized protein n=1 Tax=Elysia marginata TaxID=1093978 RepID=A0AAV4F182_9GAST|nr:hypothetical protein ElyMa_005576900 [Elysia marginata]